MKKFLTLISVLLLVFSLSACKRKDYLGVEVLTIEEVKAAEEINIKFRVPFGQKIVDVIQEIIDDFEEEYQNIKVELEVVGGYTELRDSLRYDIQSFDAPTMAVGYPDHFAEYLIGEALIPLDAFINSKNKGVGYSKEEFEDFIEDYLVENRQFNEEGYYYGLPFNKSTEVLIYNKKFFDKFDLTPPETWADAETLAKRILQIVTSGQADNLYEGLKLTDHIKDNPFVPFAWDSNANLFITATRQWGGAYTEKIDLESGSLKFDNPQTKAAFAYLNTLAGYKTDNQNTPLFTVPEYWEKSYASDPFKNLQTMVTVGSSAGIYHNIGGKVTEVGVAPIPYKDADKKFVIQQGTNVAIFAQADHLERMAAWLLIKHFLTPENNAKFSIGTSYFPVRNSVFELDSYKEFLKNPDIDVLAHSLAANVGLNYRDRGFTYFVDPAWSGSAQVRDIVGVIPAQIFVTKKSVDDAIKDAYARLGVK